MKKPGGGGKSKVVHPGIKTGSASRGSSPAAAGQLGASAAFKKDQVDFGRAYTGAPYGNQLATNVGRGGPGTGRTLYGQGGTQGTHGPIAGSPRPPSRDVLSQFGPNKSKG